MKKLPPEEPPQGAVRPAFAADWSYDGNPSTWHPLEYGSYDDAAVTLEWQPGAGWTLVFWGADWHQTTGGKTEVLFLSGTDEELQLALITWRLTGEFNGEKV